MELEDFEPTNEFEFDLSDVDVAAFESVATEDTNTTTNNQTASIESHLTEQHIQEPPIKDQQTQESQIQEQQIQDQQIQDQQKPEHQIQEEQKHDQQTLEQQIQQPVTGTGANTPGPKILLIPINTTSVPGVKHLLQLPAGSSPITVCTTNNKKQIVQLSQSSFNASKQVLNKSSSSIQNNTTINSKFSTANLSASRNVSYMNDSLGPSTPNSLNANEVPKRKPCNCTKSQCLKLYCDCFANGEFCSGCNCTNCFNCLSKEKERQKAINQCLERNPEAFRPKIGKAVKTAVGEPAPDSVERRHTKGCNCKRSGCLKNYCECYEAKILCSNLCKCCGCKNYEESFERRSLMQITSATTDKTRGILKNLVPAISNSNIGSEPKNCFITDKSIQNALTNLLQFVQKTERDGTTPGNITSLIHKEMGKYLRTVVESGNLKANGNVKR